MTGALRWLGLALGAAILAWLLARADVAALLDVPVLIGGGFVLILLARAATIVIDCAAWRVLLPTGQRPSFVTMLRLRWIAESVNTTLPVAQIGGEVVRARLLGLTVAGPARAAASVGVDFCLNLFAQILFTLFGLVLLARLGGAGGWWPVAIGLVLAPGIATIGWWALARPRWLATAERAALRLGREHFATTLHDLAEALALLAGRRAALAAALALHLLSFLGHAAELWLTLYLMGVPAGPAAATMLESLSLAVRSAAFVIPSGWGAQEASLVALAGIAGVSADSALALGLVKRAREFAVGVPGLLAWALAERRRPPPA